MLILPSCSPGHIIVYAEKKRDNGSTIVAAEQTYSIASLDVDQTLETREDLYISQISSADHRLL